MFAAVGVVDSASVDIKRPEAEEGFTLDMVRGSI